MSLAYAPVNDFTRVVHADKALKNYAQAVHQRRLLLRLKDWSPSQEIFFSPLMDVLFPTELIALTPALMKENRQAGPRAEPLRIQYQALIKPRGGFRTRRPTL